MTTTLQHGGTEGCQLPVDLIRVATSRRIETDYEQRAVFPLLRRPSEKAGSSTATEHWCTPAMVEAILSDARVRREQLKGASQAAYTTFIRATEIAVEESKKRIEWLSGTSPMLRWEDITYRSVYVIPSQFASIDLPADLKLPGSHGGPERRATYRDRAGRLCSVARAFHMWPTAYQVSFNFTKEEVAQRRAKSEAERAESEKGPTYASAEEYRNTKTRYFACLAEAAVPDMNDNSGYRFDPELLMLVRQKIKEAEYLLLSARVLASPMTTATLAEEPTTTTIAKRGGVLRLVHSSSAVAS